MLCYFFGLLGMFLVGTKDVPTLPQFTIWVTTYQWFCSEEFCKCRPLEPTCYKINELALANAASCESFVGKESIGWGK